MNETIEWLELWLEILRRDPFSGPTVLPFAQADLQRLRTQLTGLPRRKVARKAGARHGKESPSAYRGAGH